VRPIGLRRPGAGLGPHRIPSPRSLVIGRGDADLAQVVDTLRPPGGLAGCLHGRQEQRHEAADDGDDDEQFDERESAPGDHGRRSLLPALRRRHAHQAANPAPVTASVTLPGSGTATMPPICPKPLENVGPAEPSAKNE